MAGWCITVVSSRLVVFYTCDNINIYYSVSNIKMWPVQKFPDCERALGDEI
jgi:hypothetical protein